MAFDEHPRTVPELRAKYRHLCWSNPEGASDEASICAALARASFFELVDFYAVFGLDQLRETWRIYQEQEPEAVRSARPEVERIFKKPPTRRRFMRLTPDADRV